MDSHRDSGFTALYRSVWDGDMKGDSAVLLTWFYIKNKANHKDRKEKFGGASLIVKRGEMVTTQAKIAANTGLSRDMVRRAITFLKSTNRITSKNTNRETLITVINYDVYNSVEKRNPQQKPQQNPAQTPSRPPADPQQRGCSYLEEQINNETMKQPVLRASLKSVHSGDNSERARLASEWCRHYRAQFTWTPPYDAQDDLFEAAIGKIEAECGLTAADIRKVFDFISSDPFWKTQNLDPSGLLAVPLGKRERKIDSVMLKLKAKPFDAKEALRESIGKSEKPVDDIPF